MTLILKNIGRRYGKSWVLRNLFLEIKDGECLALLGPSGCGKSTTLRLIAGLDIPDEGSIYINGRDLKNVSPSKRNIGMVFQSYALFPHLSIASNLTIGLKVRGATESEQHQKVSSILTLMKLEDLAYRKPAQLSGGQRQRVALARALLRDPEVYLLDEPMSNLDAQLRESLRPEIRSLILQGQKPVVYVTHDQQEAMAMANKIAVMQKGNVEQIGTPNELYNSPASIFVASFIGRPQINLLPPESGIIKGIRPEDIIINENGINSKIIYQEWLGSSKLIMLDTPIGELRMITSSNDQIPECPKISWDIKNEHRFELTTHKRLN